MTILSNENINLSLSIILTIIPAFILVKMIGLLERRIATCSSEIEYELIPWSHAFFKVFRNIIVVSGVIESNIQHTYMVHGHIQVGIALVLSGLSLRWIAIFQMGEMWSFRVVKYKNHYVVTHGLYRFFKHPAYLGNVWLIGFMLIINANIAFVFALFWITCFYFLRAKYEGAILRDVTGGRVD